MISTDESKSSIIENVWIQLFIFITSSLSSYFAINLSLLTINLSLSDFLNQSTNALFNNHPYFHIFQNVVTPIFLYAISASGLSILVIHYLKNIRNGSKIDFILRVIICICLLAVTLISLFIALKLFIFSIVFWILILFVIVLILSFFFAKDDE